MPSQPEGLAIARDRIAAEREQRTGFLDLGRLGLTELPEELFALEHLWGLNLGSWWRVLEERHEAASVLDPNQLAHQLAPLPRLSGLRLLSVSQTDVSDLGPLSGLVALQSLDCSGTSVSDLGPLSGLVALESLDCSHTSVSDLGLLSGLVALQSLNCSYTKVSDLVPLSGLVALQSLDCSGTSVSDLPETLIWRDSLQELKLYDTQITRIPAEVLSPEEYTSCLQTLRAHLRDLKAGEEPIPDVKVLVLGNGRIGKTQICRRLRGEVFEPNAMSTHGILVTSAMLPKPGDDAHLHLWDFGGQDLYHGTHALFMRTRSIFVLVWTTQSEDTREYEYGGMTFRNHPLAYWLEYVRHLAGTNSPVLIVQNQCERAADESLGPPVEDAALGAFPFRKVLHYSAKNDRGRGALTDALQQAIEWLRENQGQARIGKGRMAVKRKLEALRDADSALLPEERKHRTLTQEHFHQLCAETGGVSDPRLLLDYLHQTGVVFYRAGLFDDRIVLDQSWALDAVYAVFHREKCYRQLRQLRGRFTRTMLDALVWQDYSVEEQALFLSLMESCGICFVYRQGDPKGTLETEYLAPDLLPGREEMAAEIEGQWDAGAPCEQLAVDLPFLHPGVMRGIISRIGQAAGISAVYWKDGVCLYERTTRSHALIEQETSASPTTWSGRIVARTQGGQAGELLRRLREWIEEEIGRAGCKRGDFQEAADPRRLAREEKAAAPEPALEFVPPPSKVTTYCVSYAWNHKSKVKVDRLCDRAKEEHGVEILRDTTGVGLGESLSKFMRRLAAGDRVFVILSDKYLKSPNCMYELFEVWRNCKENEDDFRQRIRVFRLRDAKMMSPIERARCAKHWIEQFRELDKLVREEGADLLGVSDFVRYKLMQYFAHRVGDILAVIADTLQPRDFEQLMEYGFGDT